MKQKYIFFVGLFCLLTTFTNFSSQERFAAFNLQTQYFTLRPPAIPVPLTFVYRRLTFREVLNAQEVAMLYANLYLKQYYIRNLLAAQSDVELQENRLHLFGIIHAQQANTVSPKSHRFITEPLWHIIDAINRNLEMLEQAENNR